MWPNLIRGAVLSVGVLASPLMFAVAGAGQASADPGLCVSGPLGYASACVDVPGVNVWYDGPRWHDNGWHNGWRNHDD
jgi:hypothetical protein